MGVTLKEIEEMNSAIDVEDVSLVERKNRYYY